MGATDRTETDKEQDPITKLWHKAGSSSPSPLTQGEFSQAQKEG